jgi:hypothetical protein
MRLFHSRRDIGQAATASLVTRFEAQHKDASGQRDCENGSGQDDVHCKDDPTHLGYGQARAFKPKKDRALL